MSLLSRVILAIYRFVGGRLTLEQLEEELDKQAEVNPEKLDWRHSIVDLMKLTQQDSSLEAREALAKELGYLGPLDGSAAMNTWLHKKVMNELQRSINLS